MKRANSRWVSVVFICTLALTFPACDLSFLNPPQGEPATPEPYLGTWNVVEYITLPPATPSKATISAHPEGQLGIYVERDGQEPVLHTGKFIDVNGLAVFARQGNSGSWQLLNLVLENHGSRLVLRVPNPSAIKSAIEEGELAGEIYPIDRDDELVTVTADSSVLAQYIAGRPDFFVGAFAILERN